MAPRRAGEAPKAAPQTQRRAARPDGWVPLASLLAERASAPRAPGAGPLRLSRIFNHHDALPLT